LPTPRHLHVAIVGSGFSGLGTAIRLKEDGETDFLVFERASQLGGVWRDNTYPGCSCDVPSHLYSFSFARNPSWTRSFSRQAEIWAYLEECADRFGIRPYLRFNHGVEEATWDDSRQRWNLVTTGGRFTADVLVAAVGALSALGP
jgi:cation diffusion facilitator CzcD-associated flavoprotein CzcO